MIPEQALLHMPEILTGSGYSTQHYEGGIVGAYSLALLQSLNGRNIANPISCLHLEKPFRGTTAWSGPEGKARYLRADLYLDVSHTYVGSKSLSAYGWRHQNWFEAKFFRKSTSNKQQNTGALLADLLRLIALVPDVRSTSDRSREITGRFLLHVYDFGGPSSYLAVGRQTGGGKEKRKWLEPLIESGHRKCDPCHLSAYEAQGILGEINSKLGDLKLSFEATTLRLEPTTDLDGALRQYTCILSRIDSFRIARGNAVYQVLADRQVIMKPDRKTVDARIREHVAKWINIKDTIEEQQPDAVEAEIDAIADVEIADRVQRKPDA